MARGGGGAVGRADHPNQPASVDYICLDAAFSGHDFEGTAGKPCMLDSQCRSGYCVATPDPANPMGVCSTLCKTTDDCVNEFGVDMACTSFIHIERRLEEHTAYTDYCIPQ